MSIVKKCWGFLIAATASWLVPALAFAQEAAHAEGTSGGTGALVAIGSGMAIGIAALGGTLGQGKAVSAALEGIARNPGAKDKIQTPMILGLAMIESLVILSFVIAIILTGKI
ncbi:MAG TPA: ATP synthase F0 subunit C [Bdellovibrionota bacterium]|nr:ATP synthase F0 subunit C [Bdellovibrionota bacterium]